ncbi:MAG: cation transporter [Verrucomicrobia bacterium]|nr:cation transporter [Verrucomicrobiota bacterium]
MVSVLVNAFLAALKIITGVLGNSYALIADGIESSADILSTLIVWTGLQIAAIPPDRNHPYGHGRAESLAAIAVSFALLTAAITIVIHSIREIYMPHHAPEWYTLLVLILVVVVKSQLSRFILKIGVSMGSNAMKGDAWHHRADAITSLAAFIGISVALIGGPGYECADDWAALASCTVIAFMGIKLLRSSLNDAMDTAQPDELALEVRRLAHSIVGVVAVEKCRIRKSGLICLVDIHVVVDGAISVRHGHQIAHRVKDILRDSPFHIADVIVHVEPALAAIPSSPEGDPSKDAD